MGPETVSAGKAVVGQAACEVWLHLLDERGLNDSIGDRQASDQPRFWIVNPQQLVPGGPIPLFGKICLQPCQLVLAIEEKPGDIGPAAFAADREPSGMI